MGDHTKIQWTDVTANPIRARHRVTGKVGWACVKKSTGCAHCYSEKLNLWRGTGQPFTVRGAEDVELFFDPKPMEAIVRRRKPAKVFLCDMTDLFQEGVKDEWIEKIWAAMFTAPKQTFQILTKRPERAAAVLNDQHFVTRVIARIAMRVGLLWNDVPESPKALADRRRAEYEAAVWSGRDRDWWPLQNVWLGTSVENQATADKRIPYLLKVPAAVRFLSVEPLLGPVDLRLTEWQQDGPQEAPYNAMTTARQGVSWVIVGGESGSKARPCDLAWVRSIIKQCRDAEVPCFTKQLGSRPFDSAAADRVEGSRRLFTREEMQSDPGVLDVLADCIEAMTIRLRDPKGGDPAEWPEELRVRQFPDSAKGAPAT
jgi:protein gp37